MYKIIGADGQQYGPVSAEQVRRWLAENRANANTLVQGEASTEWKPLGSFPEFGADLKGAPPPLTGRPLSEPPNPALAAKASNKLPAGICGVLLGGFGIHKFILGYTTSGLIMLLVSILTCGFGYPVMHVIGLIEGILYLTKSDEEFVRTYVDNPKPWF